MPRLFIGVPAPEDLDASGARRAVQDHAREVKLVDPEHYHVTLAFLGDTNEDKVPAVRAALQQALDGKTPTQGQARGLGAFPSPSRASVVWMGVHDAQMTPLATSIRDALDDQDIAYDDRHDFHAHLTLARLREKQDLTPLLDPHEATEFGPYPVDTVNLYASTLTPDGPEYETRETLRLEDPR